MPALGAPLDFSKYEGRNLRAHILGAAPSTPLTGQLYYNSGDNTLYFYDGSVWVSTRGAGAPADATTSSKGIVQLAGDLAGTAVSPQIAAGAVVDVDVNAAAAIAESKLNLATDAAVGTGSRRTLGAGAQQAMPGNRTLDAITAPANPLNLNNQRITSLADPTGAADGANKQYVDNLIQGLDSHPSVKAASTANLTLSGTQTVDGVALIANDRVLVKDQAAPANNGIYLVQAGAWTRATDMDTWAEVPAAYVWVEQGTTNADSGWLSTADTGGTLGTTSLTWTQFSGAGQIVAGNGLTKTGNTLDVNVDNSSVEINADIVRVKAAGVTNAMLSGAIDLTTKVTGALPVVNGGTGQTAAKAARETGLSAAGYFSSATHGAGTTISITQVTHGLRASRGIMVQVQDEASGAVEIPDIVVAATGDVTVTYGQSVTANSKRVTLIG